MGKTRRHSPHTEDYPSTSHRISRRQVARTALATQIDEMSIVSEPEPIELPAIDEAGGVARDRILTLIQEAAEELAFFMMTQE